MIFHGATISRARQNGFPASSQIAFTVNEYGEERLVRNQRSLPSPSKFALTIEELDRNQRSVRNHADGAPAKKPVYMSVESSGKLIPVYAPEHATIGGGGPNSADNVNLGGSGQVIRHERKKDANTNEYVAPNPVERAMRELREDNSSKDQRLHLLDVFEFKSVAEQSVEYFAFAAANLKKMSKPMIITLIGAGVCTLCVGAFFLCGMLSIVSDAGHHDTEQSWRHPDVD